MALRVLLADESSTIKKAIQLVLSEYGVEVKTVPTGIDVLSVALTFMPDIVVADILLNKKNGYEVCLELKNNAGTAKIPVVLMWSSFMQLDDQLFRNSRAEASLEKPFEAETIKTLFEELVPKLQKFPLKGFLRHAPLPDIEESDTFIRQKNTINTLVPPVVADRSAEEAGAVLFFESIDFNIPSFNDNDNDQGNKLTFKQKLAQKRQKLDSIEIPPQEPVVPKKLEQPPPVPPPRQQPPQSSVAPAAQVSAAPAAQERDEWSPSKTNQFVIETENYGDFEEVKVVSTQIRDATQMQDLNEQIRSYVKGSPLANHTAETTLHKDNVTSSFDEQLIREEIRQIAERICWQVIPEITEKIVREELSKLLQGIEKNI